MENFDKATAVSTEQNHLSPAQAEVATTPGHDSGRPAGESASWLPGLQLDNSLHFDKPPQPGSTSRGTIQVGNETRELFLHIPANYDPSKPAPLLLCLNGMGPGAKGMENFTQLSAAGEKDGYMVAYLDGQGTQHAWNNGQRFGGKADDAGFVNTVIDRLQSDANIDANRIFMTGFSQGASGADAIISQTGGRVAAVADVEGWMSGNEKPLSKPVSALVIHGNEDEYAPASGSDWQSLHGIGHIFTRGPGAGLTEAVAGAVMPKMEPTQYTADYYAHADGTTKVSAVDNGEMHIKDYSGGKNGTEVEMILADQRRHGWAGSPYPNPPMHDAKGQPVTDQDLVIKFFNDHPRQQ